jgi:hypothetical protein
LADLLEEKNTIPIQKNNLKKTNYMPGEQTHYIIAES